MEQNEHNMSANPASANQDNHEHIIKALKKIGLSDDVIASISGYPTQQVELTRLNYVDLLDIFTDNLRKSGSNDDFIEGYRTGYLIGAKTFLSDIIWTLEQADLYNGATAAALDLLSL